jgi:hypothetical protein
MESLRICSIAGGMKRNRVPQKSHKKWVKTFIARTLASRKVSPKRSHISLIALGRAERLATGRTQSGETYSRNACVNVAPAKRTSDARLLARASFFELFSEG